MNRYEVEYSVFREEGSTEPKHFKSTMESDTDMLGFLAEITAKLYDQNVSSYVLIRGIKLTNAKEVYDAVLREANQTV